MVRMVLLAVCVVSGCKATAKKPTNPPPIVWKVDDAQTAMR